MKGIILAGGFGTRLHPITKVTNKHLLPIYNKPMIFYPIEAMVKAGINRLIIVTNPAHIEDFVNLLGSGGEFKDKFGKRIQIVYAIQDQPSGLADGLWIAKDYIGADSCLMILGDNIIFDDLAPAVEQFQDGATIFLKQVPDPERYGIAEIDQSGNVLSVEEKPNKPKSNFAITGIYMFDNTCFAKCVNQPKSARGEYEITYINDLYLKEGKLRAVQLKEPWFDAGTVESLLETSNFLKDWVDPRSLPEQLGKLIDLPLHHDDRGDLIVAEAEAHIPFPIKRVFYITNVQAEGNRGHHAHKTTEVALVCLRGSTVVKLDDGQTKREVTLNQNNQALHIPPRVWHSMEQFSDDCLILVFASTPYNEADYLREYPAFLAYVQNAAHPHL